MASLFGRQAETKTAGNGGKRQQGHRRHKGTVSGVCIRCLKHTRGYAVADDYVIKTIRWVKHKAGVDKGNTLIVCEACLPEHKKKRGEFERSLIIYGGAGVLIAIALVVLNFSISSLLTGLILMLFFLILSHLKYTPRVIEE